MVFNWCGITFINILYACIYTWLCSLDYGFLLCCVGHLLRLISWFHPLLRENLLSTARASFPIPSPLGTVVSFIHSFYLPHDCNCYQSYQCCGFSWTKMPRRRRTIFWYLMRTKAWSNVYSSNALNMQALNNILGKAWIPRVSRMSYGGNTSFEFNKYAQTKLLTPIFVSYGIYHCSRLEPDFMC